MYIKVWNNHDKGVFKINSTLKKFYLKKISHHFSKKEIAQFKMLAEEISLVFVHNLKNGWENKLLANGNVATISNHQLCSKREIRRALASDGWIKFHAYRKNGSCAFIKKILKPAHLCWD